MIRFLISLVAITAGWFAGNLLIAADHGIQVQGVSPWHDPTGYTPVVVTVEAPRDIDVDVQVTNGGTSARATIRVTSGQPARQTILVPSSNFSGWFRLTWSAPGGVGSDSHVSTNNDDLRCALIDPKQTVNEADLEDALYKMLAATKGSSRKDELIERVQPVDLPDRWQGYPTWLVLVLTPTGNDALTDGQRQALATWTRSGGTLVVTTTELVREWNARHADVLLDTLSAKPAVLSKAMNEQHNHENWRPTPAPVPGTETVPVKTFIFLALVFAIVVGPLNLWWVRRRNARHLFLITTPLLSFVTCVLLIITTLLADGISIKRDAVQITYLDHRTQQAVRWTGCTYFAAFSRSQVELDLQAKLRVLDPESYSRSSRSSRRDGEALHIDWRAGQAFSGNVLPARLNRQLSYTEPLPERRRLMVSRTADGYQLLNGLGVDLLSVAWRDGEGKLWHGGEIAAGASGMLIDHAGDESKSANRLFAGSPLPGTFTGRMGREIAPMYERITKQPSTFSAVLAAPMDTLPGPSADDGKPPQVAMFGHLSLSATSGNAVETAP